MSLCAPNHEKACWLLSKCTLNPPLFPSPLQSLWSRHPHRHASPGLLLQHLPRGFPTPLTCLWTISTQWLERSLKISEYDHIITPPPKPLRVSITWRIKSELPTVIFQAFKEQACLPLISSCPMSHRSMHPSHAVPLQATLTSRKDILPQIFTWLAPSRYSGLDSNDSL